MRLGGIHAVALMNCRLVAGKATERIRFSTFALRNSNMSPWQDCLIDGPYCEMAVIKLRVGPRCVGSSHVAFSGGSRHLIGQL